MRAVPAASCVEAIVGALSGALTPLAVIGLVGSHTEFLWAMWQIDEHCI